MYEAETIICPVALLKLNPSDTDQPDCEAMHEPRSYLQGITRRIPCTGRGDKAILTDYQGLSQSKKQSCGAALPSGSEEIVDVAIVTT